MIHDMSIVLPLEICPHFRKGCVTSWISFSEDHEAVLVSSPGEFDEPRGETGGGECASESRIGIGGGVEATTSLWHVDVSLDKGNIDYHRLYFDFDEDFELCVWVKQAMQKAKAAEHAMSSEVRRIRRVVREKSFVFQLRDRFKYQTRWETTTGHVRQIWQDEASLWVSRSEWMSGERIPECTEFGLFGFFWCVCCPKAVLSLKNSVFHPCSGIIRIQGFVKASKAVKRCSQMLQVRVCARRWDFANSFQEYVFVQGGHLAIWTAFMFQTFCESYHIEMLFCQMHMTWIALQFTIQYNIRIYIHTTNLPTII